MRGGVKVTTPCGPAKIERSDGRGEKLIAKKMSAQRPATS
jgi:hypothetical protein